MPGDTLSFLAALCLFLSSVEYAIPKPLPFMRLGLANLPVIFAVKQFRLRGILALLLLKVVLSSFISGTTFSYVFLFSAAGSLASGLAVYLLRGPARSGRMSNVGLCLAGALANNAAQIAVARLFIFGRQAFLIAPLLLASGLASGLLLGLFANRFEERSSFLRELREAGVGGRAFRNAGQGEAGPVPKAPAPQGDAAPLPAPLLPPVLLLLLALPFLPGLPSKAAVWLLLLAAAWWSRKGRLRLLPPCILILSLTALSLLSPMGRVLCTVGGLRITDGALEAGLAKSLTLTGMLFGSQTLLASFRTWRPAEWRADAAGAGGRGLRRLSRIFASFAALSARRLDVLGGGGLIAALDARLLEAWHASLEAAPGT